MLHINTLGTILILLFFCRVGERLGGEAHNSKQAGEHTVTRIDVDVPSIFSTSLPSCLVFAWRPAQPSWPLKTQTISVSKYSTRKPHNTYSENHFVCYLSCATDSAGANPSILVHFLGTFQFSLFRRLGCICLCQFQSLDLLTLLHQCLEVLSTRINLGI